MVWTGRGCRSSIGSATRSRSRRTRGSPRSRAPAFMCAERRVACEATPLPPQKSPALRGPPPTPTPRYDDASHHHPSTKETSISHDAVKGGTSESPHITTYHHFPSQSERVGGRGRDRTRPRRTPEGITLRTRLSIHIRQTIRGGMRAIVSYCCYYLSTALITDPHQTHNVRCKRTEDSPHLPTFETHQSLYSGSLQPWRRC